MEFELKININGSKEELEGLEIPYDEIVEFLQGSYGNGVFGKFSYVSEPRYMNPNEMDFIINLGATATFELLVWLVRKIFDFVKEHPRFQGQIAIDKTNDNYNYIFILDNTDWEQVYDDLYNMKDDVEEKVSEEKALEDSDEL